MLKRILPKSIKDSIKRLLWKIEYKRYEKQQEKKGQVPYILFGIPIHGNIGDQAIAIAENKFLEDIGLKNVLEIISPDIENALKALKKIVNKRAIILIHGGGFLGNQWSIEQERTEKVIESFLDNKIIIFPQTIYFTGNKEGKIAEEKARKVFSKHHSLVICAREDKSYLMMKEIFPNVKVIFIPDIVLYLGEFEKHFEKDGILLCLRKDPEAKLKAGDRKMIYDIVSKYERNIAWTDTVIDQVININEREECFYKKLEEFAKSKLIITDRLHGMIFAAMTKTPCIVMGNYNHKVKGVYEWIKNLKYITYIDSIDEVEEKVKELYDLKVDKYDKIDENLFNELIEELK